MSEVQEELQPQEGQAEDAKADQQQHGSPGEQEQDADAADAFVNRG